MKSSLEYCLSIRLDKSQEQTRLYYQEIISIFTHRVVCLFYSFLNVIYLVWSQSPGLSLVLLYCGLPLSEIWRGTRGDRWEQLRTGMNKLRHEQAGKGEHRLVRKGRHRHVQAGTANYREWIASWGYVRVCVCVCVVCFTYLAGLASPAWRAETLEALGCL